MTKLLLVLKNIKIVFILVLAIKIIFYITMIMENYIMVLGKLLEVVKDKSMEKELRFYQVDINLKDFLLKVKNRDLEH